MHSRDAMGKQTGKGGRPRHGGKMVANI